MKTRSEIKSIAKEIVKTHYGMALAPMLLLMLINAVLSGVTAGLGFVLVFPLSVGLCLIYLMLWRCENPSIETMFTSAFQENFPRKLGGMCWMTLFSTLWSMLFVLPGIVKSYSYAMTPYILGKYTNVDAKSALKLSMKIMQGRKLELFIVDLSFIGWHLLGILTLGIVEIFWVSPYTSITRAAYFDEYVADSLATGKITEADLGL